jgi:RNA polymerase sigma-70 factor, ECF subfamily
MHASPTTVPTFRRAGVAKSVTLVAMADAVPAVGHADRPRDNDAWVRELGDAGPAGVEAQRALRVILVRGLHRALASRGVGADACEDFAQDALVRVRDHLSSFRGDSRFTTWAMAIATRIAFDELRHKRWQDVSYEAASADARAPIAFEPSPDAPPDRQLLRERVLAELRVVLDTKLTDKQRGVLIAELNGLPQAEIARQLGMERNAVYKLSHDARKRAKLHLESAGISVIDVRWVFA